MPLSENLLIFYTCQHYVETIVLLPYARYSSWDPKSNDSAMRLGDGFLHGDTYYHRHLPPPSPLRPSARAYCITLPGLPGKVSHELCLDAGVPLGPLLQELREGREVRQATIWIWPCPY